MKLLLLAGATMAATTALAQQVTIDSRPLDTGIKINVNGKQVTNPLASPIMAGDRVLVPLRGVLEELGATLEWLPDQRVVVARKGDTMITLGIGHSYGLVNGEAVSTDVPAMIMNGRTLVPLRFIAEAIDAYVLWDQPERTVVITSKIDSDSGA